MSANAESYNADWPAQYTHIIEGLTLLLQNIPNLDFTHIGSTAVPTLISRPIIDILITVGSSDIDEAQYVLGFAGYKLTSYNSPFLGVVFKSPATHPRAHEVYLCAHSSLSARAHLALRDLLITDVDLRDEFTALKQHFTTPTSLYTATKSAFLQQTLILSPHILPSQFPLLFAFPSVSPPTDSSSPSHPHRWPAIHTARLQLREYTPSDVPGMFALESSPANARYQSWEPWTRSEARRNVARGVWRQFGAEREVVEHAVEIGGEFAGRVGGRVCGGCGGGAVERVMSGEGGDEEGEGGRDGGVEGFDVQQRENVDGGVVEGKVNDEPVHVDLWYSLLPSAQGTGLATEAMHAFISTLTAREHRARGGSVQLELDIECDPRNAPSWRLAQRLGFTQHSLTERAWECKGEWVDSMVWRRVV